jgi:hypothetical protein
MLAPPIAMQQSPSRVLGANLRSASALSAFIAWAAVLLVGVGIAPEPLRAESMVVLEAPGDLEDIRATTFDKKGHAVGNSSFEITTDEAGVHRMTVTMAVEGGGRNVSEAILAPIGGAVTGSRTGDQALVPGGPTRAFRLVEEQSQATRADGVSLDFLVIDHAKGRVSCYPPDRDLTKGRHIDLPEDDRVVNVPMQLLFLPLVSGEVKAVRFQIALCRDGPVLYKMVAVRGPKSVRDEREIVEIRYGPDLGNAFAWLASRVLPKFSFWFDARDNSYLGHRMPLHRKGPEILLVRQGLTPLDIQRD